MSQRALDFFADCPNLEILGGTDAPRLSIMSLRFKHGDKDLHYGFVVSLLNDLFGIQVRGGCSCAGPYGHSLLGMDMDFSRAIEVEIQKGSMVLRPGWVRLNFNYFIGEAEFEYLLRAIALVAEHGWRMLPWYHFDPEAGVWRYQGEVGKLPVDIASLSFTSQCSQLVDEPGMPMGLDGLLEIAHEELCQPDRQEEHSALVLEESAERLRWFVLSQEVVGKLKSTETAA